MVRSEPSADSDSIQDGDLRFIDKRYSNGNEPVMVLHFPKDASLETLGDRVREKVKVLTATGLQTWSVFTLIILTSARDR